MAIKKQIITVLFPCCKGPVPVDTNFVPKSVHRLCRKCGTPWFIRIEKNETGYLTKWKEG